MKMLNLILTALAFLCALAVVAGNIAAGRVTTLLGYAFCAAILLLVGSLLRIAINEAFPEKDEAEL